MEFAVEAQSFSARVSKEVSDKCLREEPARARGHTRDAQPHRTTRERKRRSRQDARPGVRQAAELLDDSWQHRHDVVDLVGRILHPKAETDRVLRAMR